MPSKNRGGQGAKSPSRAMVETLAITDGELTALSALSGQQLSSAELEGFPSIQAEFDHLTSPHVEDAVCVTVPNDDAIEMEIEAEEFIEDIDMKDEALISETTAPSALFVEAPPTNVVRSGPILVSAGQSTSSTSYVVIQSTPGNRVITTNTGLQGKKGGPFVGRFTSPSVQPNIVQLRAAPSTVPTLQARGQSINISGVRALSPSVTAVPRNQQVTKVILPRQTTGQQIVTLPSQDGKQLLAGQIKVLGGGMKVAIQPSPEVKTEPKEVNTAGTSSRPITIGMARQMGIISPSKIQHILPSSAAGKGIIVNKVVPTSGARVTVIPQGVKSPAKILPAPSSSSAPQGSLSPQKVIIRQAPIKTMTTSAQPQQVVRISTGGQPVLASSSGLQPVQVAGRTMQYVRLVSIAAPSGTTTTSTSTTTSKSNTLVTLSSSPMSSNQISGVKMIPIAPVSTPRPVVPKAPGTQKFFIQQSPVATSQIRSVVPTSSNVIVSTAPSSAVTSAANNIVMFSNASTSIVKTEPSMQVTLASTSMSALAQSSPAQPQSQQTAQQQTQQAQSQQQFQQKTPGAPKIILEPVLTPAVIKPASATHPRNVSEPNGIRPRKPCNCTKSQCLKLYCDCFANGEFCYKCNCNCCFNNLEHEEDRQRAIRSCLERNPNAFRPKIGKGQIGDGRRHNKGCNCKRSGCLKNYCECYEAKIACSNNCKCVGCRNIEDDFDKRSLRELIEVAEREARLAQTPIQKKKPIAPPIIDLSDKDDELPRKSHKRTLNLMTDEVVSYTCGCLLAQASEAEKKQVDDDEAEKMIIEEFGRCLVEIISCVSNKAEETISSGDEQSL